MTHSAREASKQRCSVPAAKAMLGYRAANQDDAGAAQPYAIVLLTMVAGALLLELFACSIVLDGMGMQTVKWTYVAVLVAVVALCILIEYYFLLPRSRIDRYVRYSGSLIAITTIGVPTLMVALRLLSVI